MPTQPVCVFVGRGGGGGGGCRRGSGEREWDIVVGRAMVSQRFYYVWAGRVKAFPSASPRFEPCI